MSISPPIRVALYGHRGHQIQRHLIDHPKAKLVAVADMPEDRLPEPLRADKGIKRYPDLDAMLADDGIDLVSLCSERRADQAEHAIACLEAGKHVYAEKPAAVTEADLDRIVETVARTGKVFHEMAGTAFDQPYLVARETVGRGGVGDVIQVVAQKSYPLGTGRPQDEAVDGGLLMQVGIHAIRMIEHVAQQRIETVTAMETQNGNPGDGGLRIACSMQMGLAGGGVATATCNYLNPKAFPRHGNEMLRIFGTEGFVEITDGGQHTRWITHEKDHGALPIGLPSLAYHDLIFDELLGEAEMPVTSEQELHPTRIVLRAKESLGGVLGA